MEGKTPVKYRKLPSEIKTNMLRDDAVSGVGGITAGGKGNDSNPGKSVKAMVFI